MLAYFGKFVSAMVNFVATTPLHISREEWIYIFFGMVLFGFVCMRGFQQRST